MQQSPSTEGYFYSDSQEIVRILCIYLVNFRVRKIMLLVHILSPMNPVYALPPFFNIISPPLKSFKEKDFKDGTFYYFIAFFNENYFLL
jgi:hypothetical protein